MLKSLNFQTCELPGSNGQFLSRMQADKVACVNSTWNWSQGLPTYVPDKMAEVHSAFHWLAKVSNLTGSSTRHKTKGEIWSQEEGKMWYCTLLAEPRADWLWQGRSPVNVHLLLWALLRDSEKPHRQVSKKLYATWDSEVAMSPQCRPVILRSPCKV
jgi:hypothetical protein